MHCYSRSLIGSSGIGRSGRVGTAGVIPSDIGINGGGGEDGGGSTESSLVVLVGSAGTLGRGDTLLAPFSPGIGIGGTNGLASFGNNTGGTGGVNSSAAGFALASGFKSGSGRITGGRIGLTSSFFGGV